MKIKNYYLSILSCLILSVSFAQNKAELKTQALKDAITTAQATLKMDFNTVLKHILLISNLRDR